MSTKANEQALIALRLGVPFDKIKLGETEDKARERLSTLARLEGQTLEDYIAGLGLEQFINETRPGLFWLEGKVEDIARSPVPLPEWRYAPMAFLKRALRYGGQIFHADFEKLRPGIEKQLARLHEQN